jgi:hypothetical protein
MCDLREFLGGIQTNLVASLHTRLPGWSPSRANWISNSISSCVMGSPQTAQSASTPGPPHVRSPRTIRGTGGELPLSDGCSGFLAEIGSSGIWWTPANGGPWQSKDAKTARCQGVVRRRLASTRRPDGRQDQLTRLWAGRVPNLMSTPSPAGEASPKPARALPTGDSGAIRRCPGPGGGRPLTPRQRACSGRCRAP